MVAKSKTSFKIIQNEKKNYHRERRDHRGNDYFYPSQQGIVLQAFD